jgi:hypothetical protein
MPKLITEAGTLAASGSTGKLNIQLITPGWGSSGYYSPEVLEQAAKDKVFPAGTQMHIDHISASEEYDRPAGSLQTLAAVLTEDATWDGERLVAEAKLGSRWRDIITEFSDNIGTSVSVGVDMKAGEAEGRRGQIIEQMYPHALNRVDFVTVAGRGGKIDKVLEAIAGRAVEATATETAKALSLAVREAYGGDGLWTWVLDYDEAKVWFEQESEAGAHLYEVGYTMAEATATLTGDAIEVRKVISYAPLTAPAAESTNVPSNPAGVTKNQEEATMATIDDAELAQLRETAGRVPALESENTTLKTENATLVNDGRVSAAEAIVSEAFGDIEAKVTRKSLVAAALAAEAFDADALKATAVEAAAEIRAERGEGNVHGAGTTTATSREAITVADSDILNALKGGK